MHSLRHVGHRWGAVYEAHYVAFPPGSRRSQNNSLYLVSVHAERGHALRISRRTRRLNGCERVQAGQNRATIIQRNEEGKRIEEPTTKEVPPTDAIDHDAEADSHFGDKYEITPAIVSTGARG